MPENPGWRKAKPLSIFPFEAKRRKFMPMRATVELDQETGDELTQVVGLTREKPGVVLRQAIRLGLPLVASRMQAPRPEGYFAGAYKQRHPERERLEKAMLNVQQKPER